MFSTLSPSLISWLFLGTAIALEVSGTSLLNMSAGFTKILPTIAALLLYGGAFFCLSQALKTIPLGIAYAIWCGFGIVCIAAIGCFIFKQNLSVPAYIGIFFILLGTLIATIFGNIKG